MLSNIDGILVNLNLLAQNPGYKGATWKSCSFEILFVVAGLLLRNMFFMGNVDGKNIKECIAYHKPKGCYILTSALIWKKSRKFGKIVEFFGEEYEKSILDRWYYVVNIDK